METNRIVAIRVCILCTLGLIMVVAASTVVIGVSRAPSGVFCVSFLDVGQGDAIHIETPDGHDVLIDGGKNSGVLAPLAMRAGRFDRSIDMLVATHLDADHVGGLVEVLAQYDVSTVMLGRAIADSPVARAFHDALIAEDAELLQAVRGQTITLGATTTLTVLFPSVSPEPLTGNRSSVVLRVTHGDFSVLLTGDAPTSVEEFLVGEYGAALKSDVLKLGHHGSKTSTSPLLLAAAQPAHAVVSAGEDNSYGHPHPDVVARVHAHGANIHETADGSVVFCSGGKEYWEG